MHSDGVDYRNFHSGDTHLEAFSASGHGIWAFERCFSLDLPSFLNFIVYGLGIACIMVCRITTHVQANDPLELYIKRDEEHDSLIKKSYAAITWKR